MVIQFIFHPKKANQESERLVSSHGREVSSWSFTQEGRQKVLIKLVYLHICNSQSNVGGLYIIK